MIEKITNQNQIARHKLAEKINELIDAVNVLQAQVAILEEHAHPTATTKPAENVQDRMIGCTTLDIPKSYKNDQLTLATLDYSKKLEKENSDLKDELDRTRKALEIAKDTFNWIDETYQTGQEMEAEIWGKVQLAAQEITALEQKDVK
jgi:hypothetical protein